jgi:riboflavin transporter FmnP
MKHVSGIIFLLCIILICLQQAVIWVRVTVSVVIGAILMSKLDVILYIFFATVLYLQMFNIDSLKMAYESGRNMLEN